MDFFKLKEHDTTVMTEIRAGFTTFLAMLYIVPVNAFILSQSGMPLDALITATALITVIATLFNALYANTPVAMSVGMGINAYFTYGLVLKMQIPWQSALGIVFVSGLLFLLLSLTKFRVWVIRSVPNDLKHAISAGIGAFLAFIALKETGIIVDSPATLVTLGTLDEPKRLFALATLVTAIALYVRKIKGAFIITIVGASVVGWSIGIGSMPDTFIGAPASIAPIALQLDIASALQLSLLPVIVVFIVTDMFDSIGTLAGIGSRAKLFEKSEDEKKLEKTLQADAAATIAGSLLGVSTTTSFIESAAGVEEGGRTGLSAATTALLFIFTLFLLPFFKAIPPNAIYPVLIVVGTLMFQELGKIDFSDIAVTIATFFIVIMMPLTYSITDALAFGFTAYALVKLLRGELEALNVGIIVLVAISLLLFFV